MRVLRQRVEKCGENQPDQIHSEQVKISQDESSTAKQIDWIQPHPSISVTLAQIANLTEQEMNPDHEL